MKLENNTKNIFSQKEEAVLDFWQKAKIFEKSVKKEAPKGDYVFYDGPPFITGLPHYATLLPSVIKDVVPRFWTMNGYSVSRKWGWDCHGLPAENKVEKLLNLKNKKDIESLGVDKFIDACRNYVKEGSDQWRWYIDRIGRWVDMDNAYRTMDLNYMESVIWAFKQLHENGFIYEGYRTSLHCPRCATPLSKFEITMDAGSYKDVTELSAVVKFKIKEKNSEYLLAWTTTPWTLVGNLALAVGKDIVYLRIKIGDEVFVIAKDRVEEIIINKDYETLSEIKGSELAGLSYEPLYKPASDEIFKSDKVYKVYTADFVTTEDGTGIVHIAPNFGEDDFELGKIVGLPLVELMDENGLYNQINGQMQGLYYKKAGEAVKEDLEKRNIIFSSFNVTHSYPFCYRCGTALIYRTQKAWYLNIDKVREKLLDTNKKVNWIPEYFKEGRFEFNLTTAPDWCLSRSRYWGTPIPVWKCQECGEIKVVESIKEIEALSGEKINDLHKPGIDEIKFKCQKCNGTMKRVPEILDCWFESGSMPFAQSHYPFENKEDFKNQFPSDFIVEYTGQLRGWFYYLHVLANCLFDSLCFKNVMVTGVLAGTDGRKMSKSFGNYPDPRIVLDKYGSDALRIYFLSSSIMLGDDTSLSEKDIQDALRKNIMLVWNVYKFYEMFVEEAESKKLNTENKSENILDKWILTRLNQLIETVTVNLKKYQLPTAARPITEFIDDLSTWYIRRSRDRFKGDDVKDKEQALATTRYVLIELSKLMAPFMPFIAEQIWQKVTGNNFKNENKSVHLEEWPIARNVERETHNIIEEMIIVRKIVELGLAKRDEAGIKVRQPLPKFSIFNFQFSINEGYANLLKEELNVKEIVVSNDGGESKVELDVAISDELKLEGVKRDMVRQVNALRKNAGLTINDKVVLYWQSDGQMIKEVFAKLGEEIKKETLSDEIISDKDAAEKGEVKIGEETVNLKIKKI